MRKAASIADYRELARRALPRFLFDYIDGGSYDEATLAANVEDLRAIALRQRVLRDVESIDLTTELFGARCAMPVGLGPVGLAGAYARRGETQAARAAKAAGVPFTLSTVSVCSVDEVVGATEAPIWFQLYLIRDKAVVRDLIASAKAAKCSALILTVDLPVSGARHRDVHSGLTDATGLGGALFRASQMLTKPGWVYDVGVKGGPITLGNLVRALTAAGNKNPTLGDFDGWIARNFDPGADWSTAEFVRSQWDGPLIIKGVLDPEDAIAAADIGADAIVVSNHGGRQLDGALSSARALPPIAKAVGERLTVLADGGVRSGLDVVRMIALGAQGVLLGRAWAWALGARGQAGVAHMLSLIEAEMRIALALTGATRIADITAESLAGFNRD